MAFEAKKGNKSHRSHTVEAAISEATKDNMVGLNINISKKFRNLGYGSKIIKNSEKFLKKKLIIISRIKNNNKASIKIFAKNNYKVIKNNNDLMLMKII